MNEYEKHVLFDDPRARFIAEFYKQRVYLHLELRQWGMDVLRELDARWPLVKEALKNLGFEKIYAYNRDTEKVWPRFMARFGFRSTLHRNGLIFMEADSA